jgi:anti-sigma B factor antagonist
MKNAEIFVSKDNVFYKVKVTGRATFVVGPTLRNLVQRMESDSVKSGASIDLSECTGMDSTFMGILAMLALKIKTNKKTVQIANANEANKKLLNGLGLNKLFDYIETSEEETQDWNKEEKTDTSLKENAETVLQAHKVLIETDISNVDKFKNVVEQVEKEIDKL